MSTENATSNGHVNGAETVELQEVPKIAKAKSPKRGKAKAPQPTDDHSGSDTRPGNELYKDLLSVLTEVRSGNFAVRMPIDQVGISGKICDTLNEIIALNEKMTLEFTKASNVIGKQGKLNHRV